MDSRLSILAWPAYKKCYKNPYNCLLYRSFPSEVADIEEFTPKRALAGGFDILHVHWPFEEVVNTKRPQLSWLKAIAVLLTFQAIRFRGCQLVWTIHNLEPHEQNFPRLRNFFFNIFVGFLDGYISLSETITKDAETAYPNLQKIPKCVIPHGHYRSAYENKIDQKTAREKLKIPSNKKVALFLGLIRPYKNVSELIRTFKKLQNNEWILIIAGQAINDDIAKEIQKLAKNDSKIYLHLRFIPSEELQIYLNAADLAVLPFKDVTNSGSALLSLSFNCPVVVPAVGGMGELQAQVGSDWVRTYTEKLEKRTLEQAFAWATVTERAREASLANFEWPSIAQKTAEFYREIIN